jgi:hypothetical protein
MNRLLVASALVVGLLPGICPALEITNIRPRYGPFGAARTDVKCLRKDVLVITYELSDLTVDTKSGKAKYSMKLEQVDAKGVVVFTDSSTNEPVLQLGGGKMPGALVVQAGAMQAPGKYTARLTVTDLLEKNKDKAARSFEYPYEILPDKFGFVGVSAPAFGVAGTPYAAEFFLANFTLDNKNQPKADVNIRVLDEKGKEVDSVKHVLPADLGADADLVKLNMVPFRHPIYLNRPGRFTVEITAEDKVGKTKVELRYPFTVIDINTVK